MDRGGGGPFRYGPECGRRGAVAERREGEVEEGAALV